MNVDSLQRIIEQNGLQKYDRQVMQEMEAQGKRFGVENLARQMFLLHSELKKELWGGHLWNPSYCAVTVSDRSREQVSAYIEGQKEKEKRKP